MPKKPEYIFNPFGNKKLDAQSRRKAQREIAEFLDNQIQSHVAAERSPVKDVGRFAPLSEKYAEKKRALVGNDDANLRLSSSMLENLEIKPLRGQKQIKIQVAGGDSSDTDYKKAENHNNGVTLPKRQFIPFRNQKFKSQIENGISKIVDRYHAEAKAKRKNNG